MKFSKYGSTFLVKRFDREGAKRIHFMSAMTALGKKDGAKAADGTSYLDIAAFISAYGVEPQLDLRELWGRVVFNMSVSNTDDHLRNHGFVLTDKGWRLSALYDVNPIPDGVGLALNVSDDDNSLSVDLALEVAEYFGVTKQEAIASTDKMLSIIRDNWRKIAERNGLSKSSIEYMKSAFALC